MSSDDRLWDDTIGPDDLESAMAWQPVPPASMEEEEEPWQPADYFFDEANLVRKNNTDLPYLTAGDSRHTGVSLSAVLPVGPRQHGYTGICRYDQGIHIAGKNCPHNQDFDETGRIVPDGWTVQSWQ